MEIRRTSRAEFLELQLQGRMDATWSDHVSHALADCVRAGQHAILLDMARVDYLSSAGIRILVLYARQLKSIQGRFGVVNASPIVRKVLELAGLDSLLWNALAAAPATGPATETAGNSVTLTESGATAEVFDLDPQATLRVFWPGQATRLRDRPQPEDCALVEFPPQVIGIGLGALGSGGSPSPPLGEFLAAAGAAIAQPADGSNKPDYLLQQGALTPNLRVAYGLLGRGGFRRLLRFDKGPRQTSLPLSSVAKACLDAVGGETVGLVMLAETASLMGAALQSAPTAEAGSEAATDLFAFPAIRDWLSFTAESAFANSTCLVVGFAAAQSRAADLRLLRPLVRSGEWHGHFHAAAFPYRPLRRGRIDLEENLPPLFDCDQVLGVLHLLNDWRDLTGAGESRFLRGACWCAPLAL